MNCEGCHRDPSTIRLAHKQGNKRCPACHRDFPIDQVRLYGKTKQHAKKRWARDVRRKGGRVFESVTT